MSVKKKNPNLLLQKLSPASNDLLRNDIATLQKDFINHLEYTQAKDKYSATSRDFYKSLACTVSDRLFERWIETQQIAVIIKNQIHQGRSLLKMRLKAYVLDILYEFAFASEMTELVIQQLLKQKLISAEELSMGGINE